MSTIALTADLGEGYGPWRLTDDAGLLEVVTSANVACGFHAGDPVTMRRVCAGAVERGISIGAQVSYPDLRGFGRRFLDVPADELVDDLLYQIGALEAFARVAGGRVAFVRAHGALYNASARHPGHAQAIVTATKEYDATLPILCQSGTQVWARAAVAGVRTVAEVFADRGYTPDGLLVPRADLGAVLTDPDEVAARAVTMAETGRVRAVDGTSIAVQADAVVVHGDTVGAVDLARRTRAALLAAGIDLAPIS